MLDIDLKLTINFNLIKNGANVNSVFSSNPVGLDAFLVGNSPNKIKVANKENLRIRKRDKRNLLI